MSQAGEQSLVFVAVSYVFDYMGLFESCASTVNSSRRPQSWEA